MLLEATFRVSIDGNEDGFALILADPFRNKFSGSC